MDELKKANLKKMIHELSADERSEILRILLDAALSDHRKHIVKKDPYALGAKYICAMNGILGTDILKRDRRDHLVWGRKCVIFKMAEDGFTEEVIARIICLDRSTINAAKRTMRIAIEYPKSFAFANELWNKFNQAI